MMFANFCGVGWGSFSHPNVPHFCSPVWVWDLCTSPCCFLKTDAQYDSLLFPATDVFRVVVVPYSTTECLFYLRVRYRYSSTCTNTSHLWRFWFGGHSISGGAKEQHRIETTDGSQQPVDKPNETTTYELSNNSYFSKKKGPYEVSNDSSSPKKNHIFPLQAPQIVVQLGLAWLFSSFSHWLTLICIAISIMNIVRTLWKWFTR